MKLKVGASKLSMIFAELSELTMNGGMVDGAKICQAHPNNQSDHAHWLTTVPRW